MTGGTDRDRTDRDRADRNRAEPGELTPEQRAARRRRLAEVFGETLPEQTSDDAAEPGTRTGGDDEWLRRQVPPHHG